MPILNATTPAEFDEIAKDEEFWRTRRIEQLGYYSNLILAFGVGYTIVAIQMADDWRAAGAGIDFAGTAVVMGAVGTLSGIRVAKLRFESFREMARGHRRRLDAVQIERTLESLEQLGLKVGAGAVHEAKKQFIMRDLPKVGAFEMAATNHFTESNRLDESTIRTLAFQISATLLGGASFVVAGLMLLLNA